MEENYWLRAGIIALALLGTIAIVAVALSAPGDLEGEAWVVTGLEVDGTSTEPLAGTVMTAQFDDGAINGVGGCNSYFGGYELDGSAIDVGPLASTQMFCAEPEGLMDQELTYLSLLQSADEFERDGDRLIMRRGDATVITFQAAQPELFNQ